MLRRLVHGFAVSLLFLPSMAFALGLGNVETRSALNEPLDARIPLNATSEELSSLRVSLAPTEAFQRAGLDRPFLLSRLQFDLVTDDGTTPYVQVSTDSGVREPFVAFLVEVRWEGGRLLREYTLLLDPPVYTPRERTPAPVMADVQGESDTPAAGRTTAGAEGVAGSTGDGGEYGPVQRNQTAWEIALEARPDSNVSVHQMLMAMVSANPDAFVDGNVNDLRAGAILRIPSRAEIESMSVADARREFSRQMEAWRSDRDPAPEPTGTEPEETAVAEGEPEEEPESRLQVVAAGDQAGADATASLTDDAQAARAEDVQRLQREITILRESEAALRSENEELRQMAEEMRQRMDALERTINVPADPGLPSEQPADQSAADQDPASPSGEPAEAEPDARSEPSAAEPEPVADPVEPVRSPQLEPFEPETEAPWENPMLQMLGAGVLLILLLLLALVRRRRKQAREDDEALFAGAAVGLDDGDGSGKDDERTIASPAGGRSVEAEEDLGDGDPLERAETLISQGNFDDAARVLNRGLAADADNARLRLGMLEIHAANQDRGAFESDAQELYGLINGQTDPVWVRASELGRDIAPENPLFAGADDLLDNEVALTSDDDLDEALELDQGDERPASGPDPVARSDDYAAMDEPESLSDLDFGLDEPVDDAASSGDRTEPESETPKERASAGGGDDELAMDFDFDSFARAVEDDPGSADERGGSAGSREDDEFSLDFEALSPRSDKHPVVEGSGTAANTDDEPGLGMDLDNLGTDAENPVEDFAESSSPYSGGEESDDDLFENMDENGTKLDLARAYLDMGDSEGARSLLEEVMEEGNDEQKREAESLVSQAR